MTTFNCTSCGLCCKKVGIYVENAKLFIKDNDSDLAKEVASFPYKYDKTGKCENLTEDNKCKVYDTRPLICDVTKTWEKYHSHEMRKTLYHKLSESICDKLKQENGL